MHIAEREHSMLVAKLSEMRVCGLCSEKPPKEHDFQNEFNLIVPANVPMLPFDCILMKQRKSVKGNIVFFHSQSN